MKRCTKPKIKLPKDIPVGTSKKESDVMWRLKGRNVRYSTVLRRREMQLWLCEKSVMITKAL